ncbi:hypothetical protein J6TS1_17870 [Siminovitchia terrae]|uniref:Uncharacterized protein n=1 Tax=Siminovitchia terrae TaxID=1914933 RepID=A0ABQ4KXA1_SIMTE|nr:hypothetical protein [Siminovitchia terrae]GIN95917.1 hypothetical protein J6TS1_17870 [Siminovitchia terrae]
MIKKTVSIVSSVGLLLSGILMLGNGTVAKQGQSTQVTSNQSLLRSNNGESNKSFSDSNHHNQKYVYITPKDEAPPEVTNAYTTKEGVVQSLPNANPDVPIVIMRLPNK